MMLHLIHALGWQIGKVFRFVDSAAMGLNQDRRLRAIAARRTGFWDQIWRKGPRVLRGELYAGLT